MSRTASKGNSSPAKILILTLGVMVVVVVVLFSTSGSLFSSAASQTNFTNANSAINSAFSATSGAEQSGANVSSLVQKLNTAIGLVQSAQAENLTNPAQALADLNNATTIARQVSSEAPAFAQAGVQSQRIVEIESSSEAASAIIVACLIYFFGERLYHRVWLLLYRNYTVRRRG